MYFIQECDQTISHIFISAKYLNDDDIYKNILHACSFVHMYLMHFKD